MTRAIATSASMQLVDDYYDSTRGLMDGGADILLIETIFDTLNAKAAVFAIEKLFDELQPTPAGDDLRHDYRCLGPHAVRDRRPKRSGIRSHMRGRSVFGLNCALGAAELRPYVEELSHVCDCFVSAHPNAGLPNPLSPTGYDETPRATGERDRRMGALGSGEHRRRLLRHLAGAHCGSAQGGRRRAAARAFRRSKRSCACPASSPSTSAPIRCSSMSASAPTSPARAPSRKMILEGRFDDALAVARQQVENGAQVIDINMDEAMLDSKAAMDRFLKLIATEPDISRVPIMIDSSKWEVIEAGLKCIQGKGIVNSISMKEGEAAFLHQARLARRYGAAVVVMAFDEAGPGRHLCAQDRNLPARLRPADGIAGAGGPVSRPKTSSSTRTSSPSPPASRSTTTTPSTSSRPAAGSAPTCRARRSPAASPTSPSASAATTRCARRSTPSSSTTR